MSSRLLLLALLGVVVLGCGGPTVGSLDGLVFDANDAIGKTEIGIVDTATSDAIDARPDEPQDGLVSGDHAELAGDLEQGADLVDAHAAEEQDGDDVNADDGTEVLADIVAPDDAAGDSADGSEVFIPPGCVRDAYCAVDSDCHAGERCNRTLTPPQCYKLYCADDGQSCDPDLGDLLCVPGLHCINASEAFCSPCVSDCAGKVCGDDGCGGSCGGCAGAQDICVGGQCVCQPACIDRECGGDGCGGSCGTCSATTACASSLHCELDSDGDGVADGDDADDDADGEVDATDCQPLEPAVHPAATEVCNGADDDCDGVTDEPGTPDCTPWYADTDGDGVGDPTDVSCRCAGDVEGPYTSLDGSDCDDANAEVHPGAVEACNGVDDDCNEAVDGLDAALVSTPCERLAGVCGGAEHVASECVDGQWRPCGELTYLNHAARYQSVAETSCDGLDNDCDGLADEDFSVTGHDGSVYTGAGVPCGVGACAVGITACTADQVGLRCDGLAAVTPETCNGIDDDCDGLLDADDLDLGLAEAPPCEHESGVCAGATKPPSLCVGAAWLSCSAETYAAHSSGYEASTEASCDGTDNDCDGAIDEDFVVAGADGAVYSGIGATCGVGRCKGGLTACSADHVGVFCTTAALASPESCNAQDDDCDGVTDAYDADLVPPACELQAGVCAGATKAITLCVDGAWQACSSALYTAHVAAYQPGKETSCDGLDNDCSGQVDEDFDVTGPNGTTYSGVGLSCGVGKCAGGLTMCTADQKGLQCPTFTKIALEVCNSIDDDCDGKVDSQESAELLANDRQYCESQAGVCFGATKPVSYCTGGAWRPCDPLVYETFATDFESDPELSCDGADNDCDGLTDEAGAATCNDNNPCTNDTCGAASGCLHANNLEQCPSGYCEGGGCHAWICTPNQPACNGEIATSCNARGNGYLAGGVTCSLTGKTCKAGACVCKPACTDMQCGDDGCGGSCGSCGPYATCSAAGICESVDKDGDGDPDLTDCAPTNPAIHHGVVEICNGVDDNCSGHIDESHPDVGTICEAGVGECMVHCVKICNPLDPSGATVCDRDTNPPGVETCNGLDDDCDGETDSNGDLRETSPACENQVGICKGSVKWSSLCVNGEWQPCTTYDYVRGWQAVETGCDGLDNDCDGTTDEGYVAQVTGCGVGSCATTALTTCVNGVVVDNCVPKLPTAESCNGKDDDCDGLTDTADADLATQDVRLCEKQAGICAGSKKPVSLCSSGGWVACTTATYTAHNAAYQTVETLCDGVDTDCDGARDDEFKVTGANGTVYSGSGLACGVGACAGGTTACATTSTLSCPTFANATTEKCANTKDDDCDGSTDEAGCTP